MQKETQDLQLETALSLLDETPSVQRLQRVRRSVLIAASQKKRGFFASFLGMEPAFLMATALLGLVIGVSVPLPLSGENAGNSISDLQQPGLFEGDAG